MCNPSFVGVCCMHVGLFAWDNVGSCAGLANDGASLLPPPGKTGKCDGSKWKKENVWSALDVGCEPVFNCCWLRIQMGEVFMFPPGKS